MQKRPIEISDLKNVRWISDPQFSPQGHQILYVQKQVHPTEKTKYTTQIWSVTPKQEPKLLTGENTVNSTPRWSPCGKTIAFVSARSGSNQIWLLPVSGGEARQLTKFSRALSLVGWSPDGSKLLASCKCKPSDFSEKKEEVSDVKVITKLHYKMNGAGFHDDRNTHLFVVDAKTGETKQLTEGEFDHGSATWTPDGSKVLFAAKRYEDADYVQHNDLYTIDISNNKVEQITSVQGQYSSPSYSPDGQFIAYFGHQHEAGPATMSKLYCIPATGGQPQLLSLDFDFSVGNAVGSDMTSASETRPVWSLDQKELYFTATTGGVCRLFGVDAKGGIPTPLTPSNKVVYGTSFHLESNQVAVIYNEPANMGDLFLRNLKSESEERLTSVNQAWYDEVHVSLPEHYSFTADNGATVEGWLLKPYGFQEGKKYPMILQIHGGPHVAYGLTFNHEMQVLCGLGYAVLYTNPQGSLGYGQEFNNKTHHDWGGQDYRDLMLAIDVALEKWSWLDEDRLGVTGGSYGGYMTNWMLGHTNRFKAAVSLRSTSNRFSMFGTSDVGYNNGNFEFDGKPWINYEHYLMHSPIMYIENVQTPVLLIHSEQDLRCPIEQGEQFFTALKFLKKEAMFVRFPNENHELSRSGQPNHRIERLQHLTNWFLKYIPA